MPQAEVVKAKAKPSLVLKQQYGVRKLVTKSVNPRYKEFGHGSYTLKAVPGVPRLFKNKVVNPLIPSITAPSDAPVKAVYTLTGQRVSASALTPGVDAVTRADGTAAKLFVK